MKHPRCPRCGGLGVLKDHADEYRYCLDWGWEYYAGPVRSIEVRPVQLDMSSSSRMPPDEVDTPSTPPVGRRDGSDHRDILLPLPIGGPPSRALAVNREGGWGPAKAAGALLHPHRGERYEQASCPVRYLGTSDHAFALIALQALPYGPLRELRCAGWRENTQQGTLADRGGTSFQGSWVSCRLAVQAGSGMARSRAMARVNWVSKANAGEDAG